MTHVETEIRQPAATKVSRWADDLVEFISYHWLTMVNLAIVSYLSLVFTAPLLMHLGLVAPARVIYTVFSVFCHQLPERSFFLFGTQASYSIENLDAVGLPASLDLLARRAFIGNDLLGYKVAVCQRDLALFGAMLVAGIIYRELSRRWRWIRLPVKSLLVLWSPLAIDGLTQLLGLRESTWQLRLLTGTLASCGSAWVAYPLIDIGMIDIRVTSQRGQDSVSQIE